MICIHNARVVKRNLRAVSGSRAASDQDFFRCHSSPFHRCLELRLCESLKTARPLDRQQSRCASVALELRSLALDNGAHSGGDILNRNAAMAAKPIAVQRLYGKTGELKDGLTYRLAGIVPV